MALAVPGTSPRQWDVAVAQRMPKIRRTTKAIQNSHMPPPSSHPLCQYIMGIEVYFLSGVVVFWFVLFGPIIEEWPCMPVPIEVP